MNEWTEYHSKCEVSVGVIFNGLVNLFLITVVILLTFHPHPKTGLLHWLQSTSKKEISRNNSYPGQLGAPRGQYAVTEIPLDWQNFISSS